MMFFNASDLNQFLYCKRKIYFFYVMPVLRRATYKMESGSKKHEAVEVFEKRRVLKKYGVEAGEKVFNFRVVSRKLKFSGVIDLLVVSQMGWYPVDFKNTYYEPFLNHKVQICAYSIALEENHEIEIAKGFIYNIPLDKLFEVKITNELRRITYNTLKEMMIIVESELFPDPPLNLNKCVDCEVRNYCNDIF